MPIYLENAPTGLEMIANALNAQMAKASEEKKMQDMMYLMNNQSETQAPEREYGGNAFQRYLGSILGRGRYKTNDGVYTDTNKYESDIPKLDNTRYSAQPTTNTTSNQSTVSNNMINNDLKNAFLSLMPYGFKFGNNELENLTSAKNAKINMGTKNFGYKVGDDDYNDTISKTKGIDFTSLINKEKNNMYSNYLANNSNNWMNYAYGGKKQS